MSRVRITGGAWRSRLIQVVDAPGLRPTPDRVRETLFNWLGQDLAGWRCLDLFAGSGILGFEAASRGAAAVTLVERDAKVHAQLKRNAASFDDPRIAAVLGDGVKFAASAAPDYDLIFLDPPYRKGLLDQVADILPAAPDARVYAEAEYSLDSLGPWRVVKRGRAGQVFFHLLERS